MSEIFFVDYDKILIDLENKKSIFNKDCIAVDTLINFFILNGYLKMFNHMYLECPYATTPNETLISIGFYSDENKCLHRHHDITAEISEWNLEQFQEITKFLFILKKYNIPYKNYSSFTKDFGNTFTRLSEFTFTFNLQEKIKCIYGEKLLNNLAVRPTKFGCIRFTDFLQKFCIDITKNDIFKQL